jgi:hypothetical protein
MREPLSAHDSVRFLYDLHPDCGQCVKVSVRAPRSRKAFA